MKVGFISLGCSKNLVDTEMFIGLFKKNGHEIVNTTKEAEIIVINTCGFITSAKEEAINTIIEMSDYKENGNCKYLIVTGCLVQRYLNKLKNSLPEVDLFISISDYEKAWSKIGMLLGEKHSCQELDYMNRVITTGDKTAYLKIAEGCSNNCTYCAIPKIRGPFVSRKIEDVVAEAKMLEKEGIKEIIIIAQDTTKYGVDIYGEYKLTELLRQLSKLEGIEWIRFLYAYPESITDELIEEVKNNDKICSYFDMPIQHISDTILKRMNRKSDKEHIRNLIVKIRENIPNAIIRTSIIVGFPGETDNDFIELYEFLKEFKLDKVGVFKYSKEDGTPAEKIPGHIHYRTKQSRYSKIMELQQKIVEEKLKGYIGNDYSVLIEGLTEDGEYYIGRTYMDSPDVDGVAYIRNNNTYMLGEFIKGTVKEISGYDLIMQ